MTRLHHVCEVGHEWDSYSGIEFADIHVASPRGCTHGIKYSDTPFGPADHSGACRAVVTVTAHETITFEQWYRMINSDT
jgi:hypothetical protein